MFHKAKFPNVSSNDGICNVARACPSPTVPAVWVKAKVLVLVLAGAGTSDEEKENEVPAPLLVGVPLVPKPVVVPVPVPDDKAPPPNEKPPLVPGAADPPKLNAISNIAIDQLISGSI